MNKPSRKRIRWIKKSFAMSIRGRKVDKLAQRENFDSKMFAMGALRAIGIKYGKDVFPNVCAMFERRPDINAFDVARRVAMGAGE